MLALAPATAAASTGQISNAFATPDWNYARLDISASGTACGQGDCSWLAVVTAQPSLPEYACQGDEALDSDPNTLGVWTGPGQTTNGSVSASVPKAAILHGVYGQRLCLSIIGNHELISPVCEVQRKVLEEFYGEPFPPCELESFVFAERLAGVVLGVEPPPAPPAPSMPSAVPTAASKEHGHKRSSCPPRKRKVIRHGKVVCVKRHGRTRQRKHRRGRHSPSSASAANR